jgi:hypothetical protein
VHHLKKMKMRWREGLPVDEREPAAEKIRTRIAELNQRKAEIFASLRDSGLAIEQVNEEPAADPLVIRHPQGAMVRQIGEGSGLQAPEETELPTPKPKTRMIEKSMVNAVMTDVDVRD